MKDQLDPFRILLGVLVSQNDSDLVVAASNLAGLAADLTLAPEQSGTHKERIRALLPKITTAYDALTDEAKLVAAQTSIVNLGPRAGAVTERLYSALAAAGWAIENGTLVVADAKLREMFFPKGSQWDAFVVLRKVVHSAKATITIIDPYADGTVFQLLANHPAGKLQVQILCSKNAGQVAAEAKKFVAQFPDVALEVRSSQKDFHDRFVVLDGKDCIHVGASINHAGKTAFMISAVEDESNRAALLASVDSSWKAGTVVQ